MGTLSWSITESGRLNKNIQGSRHVASGAFTTSTTAAPVTGMTLALGDVVVVHADEAMRIRFGGIAATASTGHYIPAGIQREFEAGPGDTGAVSAVDVA